MTPPTDTVAVEGTPLRDRIAVTRDGKDAVLVAGLAARTRITGSEPASTRCGSTRGAATTSGSRRTSRS